MAVIMIHATRMLIALFMSNFNKALDAAVLLPLNMLILGGTAYFLGWLLGRNQRNLEVSGSTSKDGAPEDQLSPNNIEQIRTPTSAI